MEFLWDLARDWAVYFQRDLFRYLLATTCVSLAVSWLFRRWMDRRRIQKRRASWRNLRREFSYSMLTLCVFTNRCSARRWTASSVQVQLRRKQKRELRLEGTSLNLSERRPPSGARAVDF